MIINSGLRYMTPKTEKNKLFHQAPSDQEAKDLAKVFVQACSSIESKSLFPLIQSDFKAHRKFSLLMEAFLEKSLAEKEKHNRDDEDISCIKNLLKSLQELEEHLQFDFTRLNLVSLGERYHLYSEAIREFLEQQPESLQLPQSAKRFLTQDLDASDVKAKKFFKRGFYFFNNLGVLFFNLFKKPNRKKPYTIWYRKVPVRGIYHYYFLERKKWLGDVHMDLLKARSESVGSFHFLDNYLIHWQESSLDELKKWSQQILKGHQKVINDYEKLIAACKVQSSENIEVLLSPLEKDLCSCGTLELRNKRFSKIALKEKSKNLDKTYRSGRDPLSQKAFLMMEDMRLSLDLMQIKWEGSIYLDDMAKIVKNRIRDHIHPPFSAIAQTLKDLLPDDSFVEQAEKDWQKELSRIKYRIRKDLSQKQIPESIENLLNQNFGLLFEKLEVQLEESIDRHENTRAVKRGGDEKQNKIDYINPRELLSYESLVNYKKETKKVKQHLFQALEKTKSGLLSIDKVVLYTIEAVNQEKEKEKSQDQKSKLIIEGFHRAISRVEEEAHDLERQLLEQLDAVAQALGSFNATLSELTDIEKLSAYRMRIAKAKALDRSLKFKERAQEWVVNQWDLGNRWSRLKYQNLETRYHALLKRLGYRQEATQISSEISDFLSDTEKSLEFLPFVYQRLFKPTPLDDKMLFEPRPEVAEQMDKALANWQNERFAATLIVGEKGSGATTLLNIFQDEKKTFGQIKRLSPQEHYYSEKACLEYLGKELFNEPFDSLDQALDRFFTMEGRQIIILENIHLYFLRKIDGFEGLKVLLKLISATNQKIYWLSNINRITFDYLNKTIQLGDYFAYVMHLKAFSAQQIQHVIELRNQVSGYNIRFLENETHQRDRKFNKLSEREKSQFLKKEYFEALNEYAKSNLSLGLLFWLRSAVAIHGDVIEIAYPKALEKYLLAKLSDTKVFTIQQVLLHDWITEVMLKEALHMPSEQAKSVLLVLQKDGILLRHGNRYFINPLLYRQAIKLMRSKNLIS